MTKSILVTGATGLLGTEIIRKILRQSSDRIYALVRAENSAQAEHRLRSFWWDDPELLRESGSRVLAVCGDITEEGLGLDRQTAEELAGRISVVIHTAAETGVQNSKQKLELVNTLGTKNVVEFAKRADRSGGLDRFVHISTAYVAGDRNGLILETDPLPDKYSTHYEASKADAEIIVSYSDLPYTICRPGMIIGNTETGRTRYFNTIYYVMKLLMQGKLPVMPVSADKKVNIVPADYVAEAVTVLAKNPQAEGRAFHITAPEEMQPEAGELVDYLLKWAEERLNIRLKRPAFVPMNFIKKAGDRHNRRESEKQKQKLSNLLALTPYFYDDRTFDRRGTDEIAGRYDLDWHDYIDVIIEYACRNNFMYGTDRNVFEQILFRQQSRKAPIKYYDISRGGITETTGEKMRSRILRSAAVLRKLGIAKGDKVALTGINCTDYFVLDVALGLLGAVTVPVYYTTPPEEIDLLLNRSGAFWFFVGDERIMKNIDKVSSEVSVMRFEQARKMEDEISDEEQLADALVDPEDLATIRYTSGTTGEPKGVMFNAGQLKWMGQVLTDLLPWKEKQHEMRYMSFLPLSHVVEGILASYAPYFALCPVKYYYLNDFNMLTEALPKVRPTVFFSVPRFYEKLWQQIEQNPQGKKYLQMDEGPAKKLLRAVLRKAVLRKAGLDCCSQLIVGSAPISEELLLKFRELGIEIHNAYGQTEAPLITINRLGDNVIPSIGTPLPDTDVTAEEDGELIVSGPQVCLGYYGLETDSISGGVLRSGDLGRIDDAGHIYLIGRKKEMIITSYGKNINRPKIEERLKNLPQVSEAVLIGENRPYCTALLWTDGETDDMSDYIEEMNRNLSHPEQIRRWKIADRPLSISAGELTPNLKVRRAVVEEHYRDEIEGMYN